MKQEESGLALLRKPFPANQISKLPKPYKSDSPKGNCKECGGYHGLPAAHLDYVGHAALTDRLLDADPSWQWEPMATGPDNLPAFDKTGGMWIKLTVCGVTRLGYGNAKLNTYADIGAREKEVIGDALRNAAMRFGAALDLWHKGDLHVEDDDDGDAARKAKDKEDKEKDRLEVEAKLLATSLSAGIAHGKVSEAATVFYGKTEAEKTLVWKYLNAEEKKAITAHKQTGQTLEQLMEEK